MEGGAGGAAEQVTTDGGLPSTGTGSLLVLGLEPTFKVSGAALPLEALGEGPSLSPAGLGAPGEGPSLSPACLGAPGAPGLWTHFQALPRSPRGRLFTPCVSQSLIGTPVLCFRAHLKTQDLITLQTDFPHKVTFTGLGTRIWTRFYFRGCCSTYSRWDAPERGEAGGSLGSGHWDSRDRARYPPRLVAQP